MYVYIYIYTHIYIYKVDCLVLGEFLVYLNAGEFFKMT